MILKQPSCGWINNNLVFDFSKKPFINFHQGGIWEEKSASWIASAGNFEKFRVFLSIYSLLRT